MSLVRGQLNQVPMARLSLMGMPIEILEKILSNLRHEKKSSLLAAMKSCRILNTLGGKYLAQSFKVGYDTDRTWPTTIGKIYMFCRYIFHCRPELAISVKSVVVGSFSTAISYEIGMTPYPAPQPFIQELSSYQLVVYRFFTRYSCLNYHDSRNIMMQNLRSGHDDAFLALLLMGCHSLEDFGMGQSVRPQMVRLAMWTSGRLHAIAFQLRQRNIPVPGCVQPHLKAPNLKSFYQELRAPERDEATDEIIVRSHNGYPLYQGHEDLAVPFFRMLNARRYECILAHGHNHRSISFGNFIETSSSTVEHIVLRRSRLAPGALLAIIGCCIQLRSFEYIRGNCFPDIENDSMPCHLMQAILQHKETLESLVIDFDDYAQREIWWEAFREPDEFYLGYHFNKMQALKKLVVAMQLVTGVTLAYNHTQVPGDGMYNIVPFAVADGAPSLLSCLPKELEELTVFSCEAIGVPMFKELIEAVKSGQYLVKLRKIMILYNPPDEGFEAMALEHGRPLVSVMRQTERTRNFDLSEVPLYNRRWITTIPDQVPVLNLCSRIYSEAIRNAWLKWRYLGVGLAFIEDARVLMPVVHYLDGVAHPSSEADEDPENGGVKLNEDSDEEMT
ncbi:hypothetical protein CDD81_5271 [Ophiocordyceps australis]|uniref:F-box domain-containing protein n=1 Tax=Ophiocordyceps australis TaxID=1399860 RepID=A0A2C5XC62_9HYPO|nr:hypothetical protein CDD81_5271 [Ophiocordyceps australis]